MIEFQQRFAPSKIKHEGDKAEVQMCPSRTEVKNTRAGPPHWDLGSNMVGSNMVGSNMVGSNTSTIALLQSSSTEDHRASPTPSYESEVLLGRQSSWIRNGR